MTINYEGFIKEPWDVVGLNACNIFIGHYPLSAMVNMHKNIGYGHTRHLFIFTKEYLEYHYSARDLENIGRTFLEKMKNNRNYLDNIIKKTDEAYKILEKFSKKFNKINLEDEGTDDLIALFHEVFNANLSHIGYSHLIEGIAYVINPMIENALRKVLEERGLEKNFNDYFTALAQPIKPSFVDKANISMLKIAKSISKSGKDMEVIKRNGNFAELSEENKKLIEEHTAEYFWIRINYLSGEPLTEKDFFEEAKDLIKKNIDYDEAIKKAEELYAHNKKAKAKIIKELKLRKDFLALLEIADKNMYWQDERKEIMLKCIYYMGLIIKELAKRYMVSFSSAKQLLPTEINKDILDDMDKSELKKRAEKCVVLFQRDEKKGIMETKVLVGNECDDFIAMFRRKEEKRINNAIII
ncbi:MAG: hypothetical protein N3D84_00510 [Candidatus Woesearchaeota archaeon]|nr:hypothetical protein [Candidatus Woesearchaeota archaeon]